MSQDQPGDEPSHGGLLGWGFKSRRQILKPIATPGAPDQLWVARMTQR